MESPVINPLSPIAPVGSVLKRKKRQQQPAEAEYQDELDKEEKPPAVQSDDDSPASVDTYA